MLVREMMNLIFELHRRLSPKGDSLLDPEKMLHSHYLNCSIFFSRPKSTAFCVDAKHYAEYNFFSEKKN